jgi:hypothetical protein
MDRTRRINSRNNKGASHFLLLTHLRAVVEKHGGAMRVDENPYTIVLTIPHHRKEACFYELEGMLDSIKQFVRLVPTSRRLNPPVGANPTGPY